VSRIETVHPPCAGTRAGTPPGARPATTAFASGPRSTRRASPVARAARTARTACGARAARAAVVGWLLGLSLLLILLPAPARAADIQLVSLDVARTSEGVELGFSARFQLPPAVEEALRKGVPLHFTARAELYKSRWLWRDSRVASAERTWRLAWQPLTDTYRVSFAGLNQNFDTLHEALAALRGAARWKIADASELEADGGYYVEFSYRLDTDELPRPMQIGLAGEADWNLSVERTLPLN
jgi:hypothetical protein